MIINMGKKIYVLTLSLFLFIISASSIIAQGQGTPPLGQSSGKVCVPNPLDYSTDACSPGSPDNPEYTDPRVIIGNGIKTVLGIIGSVALAVFIYGGVLWLTSGGNETRIKKGKDVILWATLGLVIIFAAYAIVGFFLGGGFLSIFFI